MTRYALGARSSVLVELASLHTYARWPPKSRRGPGFCYLARAMDCEALDRLSRKELLTRLAEVIGRQQDELAAREAAIERPG